MQEVSIDYKFSIRSHFNHTLSYHHAMYNASKYIKHIIHLYISVDLK